MPVVFIVALSILNLFLNPAFRQSYWSVATRLVSESANASQTLKGADIDNNNEASYLSAVSVTDLEIAQSPDEVAGFVIIDGSFLSNPGSSLSNILPARNGLMIYKVQPGDNLSSIAAKFGISLETILGANPKLSKKRYLRVGQELVILPVSGALHEVKEGESLNSIASLYGVPPALILKYNSRITPGSTVIIPGVQPKNSKQVYFSSPNWPNLKGYFAMPATGWNWGQLHYNNAVDIANACGSSVYAAAEGLVTKIGRGWNSGYGNDIVIEHPNNVSTHYAHLQKPVVEVGQYVVQGDLIGYMGNTGNTHGPTGCHLHFEVLGAQNPFAKKKPRFTGAAKGEG